MYVYDYVIIRIISTIIFCSFTNKSIEYRICVMFIRQGITVGPLLSLFQNDIVLNEAITEEIHCAVSLKFADTSTNNLTQEGGGSLSDSGISDSGSEQELSERERRLAALRRLTRSLETQLAPESEALTELWRKVEDTEIELRNLQKQCRELIVRTAASVDARATKRTTSQTHYYAE